MQKKGTNKSNRLGEGEEVTSLIAILTGSKIQAQTTPRHQIDQPIKEGIAT